MRFFININTRTKLLISFSMLLAIIAVMAATAYIGMRSVERVQRYLVDVEFPISIEVAKIRNIINRERTIESRIALASDTASREQWIKDLKESEAEANNMVKAFLEHTKGLKEYGPMANEFIKLRAELIRLRNEEFLPLAVSGKVNEANALFLGTHELVEKIRDVLINISKFTEQKDIELKEQSQRLVNKYLYIFIVTGAVACMFVIAMTILMDRIIAKPLIEASAVAEKIAYGDLTVKMPSDKRTDEIGTLIMSLGMMIESLRTVTGEIHKATESLSSAKDAKEIAELGKKLKNIVEQFRF